MAKDRSSVFMLDVRQKTGDRTALPYSYLTAILLNASGEILLEYSGHSVIIRGRNLGDLYTALINHRVDYVQEEDLRYDTGAESDPFIKEIVVK